MNDLADKKKPSTKQPEFPSEKNLDQETTAATTEKVVKGDKKEATAKKETVSDDANVTKQHELDQAEIKKLQALVASNEDKYLRAEAEIQNMNNRFKKEREQLAKYDGQDLAKSVLPVVDNLERALAIDVSDPIGRQLKKGIQMVYDHLESALKEHNVTEIETENKTFDPTIHQAVQTVPVESDQKPETIVKVLQKGYYLKDRVLRPAMVVVAQ